MKNEIKDYVESKFNSMVNRKTLPTDKDQKLCHKLCDKIQAKIIRKYKNILRGVSLKIRDEIDSLTNWYPLAWNNKSRLMAELSLIPNKDLTMETVDTLVNKYANEVIDTHKKNCTKAYNMVLKIWKKLK